MREEVGGATRFLCRVNSLCKGIAERLALTRDHESALAGFTKENHDIGNLWPLIFVWFRGRAERKYIYGNICVRRRCRQFSVPLHKSLGALRIYAFFVTPP